MNLSPAHLWQYTKTEEGRKKIRYAGVSVVFVPVGQGLFVLFGALLGSYTKASLLTAALLTLPNFYANKRNVRQITSKDDQRGQILVFWVAAMLGVSFATGLTYFVEQAMTDKSSLVKAVAGIAAQLTGFGIVWVGRFLILDRWLFKMSHHGDEPSHDEIDDFHKEIPI